MTQRDRTLRRVAIAATAAVVTAAAVVTFPMIASAEVAGTESVTVEPATSPSEPDPTDDAGYDHDDPKDPKDHEDPKDPQDPKDHEDPKDHDDPKDPKDPKDPDGGFEFAPFDEAAIVPGVELATYTSATTANLCTANFIYTEGDRVFIGSAGHCGSLGTSSDINGCTSESVPLGTRVDIAGLDGETYVGELVYSSWLAMQEEGETDLDLCNLNDLALVEIAPEDVDVVNPSVPVFGGPEGLDDDGVEPGERVFSYQNAADDGPLPVMRAKQGINLQEEGDGRSHIVITMTPGFPGDSGAGYLDGDGNAIGVLSTLIMQDGVWFNGVSDLAQALDYASGTGFSAELVPGTESFTPNGVLMDALPALPAAPAVPDVAQLLTELPLLG